jgi:hypothetical protein
MQFHKRVLSEQVPETRSYMEMFVVIPDLAKETSFSIELTSITQHYVIQEFNPLTGHCFT